MKEMNQEILLDFLKSSFPNADIKYIASGWTSLAFQVDDNIVRFPRETPRKYIKESVVCDVLRNLISFDLPRITIVQDTEFPYSIHKTLVGKTWNMDYVHTLDKQSQILLAHDCAKFLSEIHGIDTEYLNNQTKLKNIDLYFEKFGPRDFEKLELYLKEYFDSSELLSLAKKYEQAVNFKTADLVFCHNDFHGNNCVLNTNNRLTAVFDWGNCRIDERVRDFMRLFFNGPNKDFFYLVSDEYEKMTGIHIAEARLLQLNMIELMNMVYWLNVQESLKPIKDRDLNDWVIPAISRFI